MPEPFKHPKTGGYYYRRVVPEKLRKAVGRREIRISLDTKTLAEAKRRYPDAAARAEAILAGAGEAPLTLTQQQVVALAGVWYRRELADWEAEPGDSEDWDTVGMDDADTPAGRERSVGGPVDHLLASEGLRVDSASRTKLIDRVFYARVRLFHTLQKRAGGDYRKDAYLDTFAAWEPPKAPGSAPKDTFTFPLLIAAWAKEQEPPAKTVANWTAKVKRLTDHLAHDDVTKITKQDVVAWKDGLVTAGSSVKTVGNYLAAINTLLNWAERNGRIVVNPARGVRAGTRKGRKSSRLPYSEEDAKTILAAARREKGSRRWVPWLLAYTGMRLEEVCGADAKDIKVAYGVPYFDLKHRELKTEGSLRRVPLHPALIKEGLLDYVAKLPKGGPLCPDVKPDKFDKRSGVFTKWYGRWQRGLGIADKRLVAHSWRHRFKDWCRDAEIHKEIHDALTGHLSADEGDKYGEGAGLKTLARAVAKLPAIKV